jgi:hypothetical protein
LRRYFCAEKVQTLNVSTKKLCEKFFYEKGARRMLVKLTSDLLVSRCCAFLRKREFLCRQGEGGGVMLPQNDLESVCYSNQSRSEKKYDLLLSFFSGRHII